MNEQDILNTNIIKGIVSKHFSLRDDSLDFFAKEISSGGTLPPELSSILGEDKRLRVRLTLEDFSKIDIGWKIFYSVFSEFIEENKVEYVNFNRNLINGKKLFKAIIEYYKERDVEAVVERFYKITEQKFFIHKEKQAKWILDYISDRKMSKFNEAHEIVLSANFADWFLCSTAESWDSCLDLESKYDCAYWSGLPGLIGDKGRIMIYITNGDKKEYNKIKVDRNIFRVFGILGENNTIALSKTYPINIINAEFLDGIFNNFRFYNLSDYRDKGTFTAKYPITPLYFNNGQGCFIFNDFSKMIKVNEEFFISSDKHGGYCVANSDGEICEETTMFYCDGLNTLIGHNETLDQFFEKFETCYECGIALHFNECYAIAVDDGNVMFCEECYDEAIRNKKA